MAKTAGKPAEQEQEQAAREGREPTQGRETGPHVVDVWQFSLATVAALLIGALFLQLPDALLVGPRWLLLVIEVALLTPPALERIANYHLPRRVARGFVYALLVTLTLELALSLGKLVLKLADPNLSPRLLLISGILLWVANVLIFATWYWETDGDGPVSRHHTGHQAADFQFPQQEDGNTRGWRPGFVDYLFLAFCTATALSPADTLPLSRRAKALMMVEAVISMVVIVMLLARFVNVV
ncbi:MAG TPA: hypothetical protein VFQ25_03580 [Ktedonobacterales bacterium]|nr:hypothetical protein [Ktedonobacterales bacterium]